MTLLFKNSIYINIYVYKHVRDYLSQLKNFYLYFRYLKFIISKNIAIDSNLFTFIKYSICSIHDK